MFPDVNVYFYAHATARPTARLQRSSQTLGLEMGMSLILITLSSPSKGLSHSIRYLTWPLQRNTTINTCSYVWDDDMVGQEWSWGRRTSEVLNRDPFKTEKPRSSVPFGSLTSLALSGWIGPFLRLFRRFASTRFAWLSTSCPSVALLCSAVTPAPQTRNNANNDNNNKKAPLHLSATGKSRGDPAGESTDYLSEEKEKDVGGDPIPSFHHVSMPSSCSQETGKD
ncbi:hypothetical protein B0T20DRAFT_391954 [Sordaria brevicollis]|uniref:Uncharacterized protein n=1 Tax=Sordaria brevicollis TaxID=83679 RepID=A0AAE0PFC2_SORBR|nr:hypothetical protein B0T20DRAFT_391954 [Sordaria brevicollis]